MPRRETPGHRGLSSRENDGELNGEEWSPNETKSFDDSWESLEASWPNVTGVEVIGHLLKSRRRDVVYEASALSSVPEKMVESIRFHLWAFHARGGRRGRFLI
ncbi:hypothetical protein ANTRET_LOCUS227 [Anthophora retusa]